MTYDLVAFDPDATSASAFDEWYAGDDAWPAETDHEDPGTSSERLRRFCELVWAQFPPMNASTSPTGEGAHEVDRGTAAILADYTYAPRLVLASFSREVAPTALRACADAAARTGVALALLDAGSPTPVLEPDA